MQEAKEFPIELVEKEMDGNATANDVAVLNSNPELWRQHLVSIKQRVDLDIINKKSESVNKGYGDPKAIAEFHDWRRRAVYFKSLVEERLSHLKRTLKEKNDREYAQKKEGGVPDKMDEVIYLLEDILAAIKAGAVK